MKLNLFKKPLKNAKPINQFAMDYEFLKATHKLNRIENYIIRFDKDLSSLRTFKNVCLTLQDLRIYNCLAIKFYCSKILDLDKYPPYLRPLKFNETTLNCLSFILKNRINVLDNGDVFNSNTDIGLPIKQTNIILENYKSIIFNNLNLKETTTKINEEQLNQIDETDKTIIFRFIDRLKQLNINDLMPINDHFYIKQIDISQKVYKGDSDKLREFFRAFLKSEYTINGKIESIVINRVKQQVIIVNDKFADLCKL